jgi:hypothetical protein
MDTREVGLIKRDARMVSTIHSRVNEQGVGEYHQFYDDELESAEKDSTRNWSRSQSKSRNSAQRSGSGVRVSVGNANGLGAVIRGVVLLMMIVRD